jgi:molybdopterin-guanine dinucleotide biosynthesis protein A
MKICAVIIAGGRSARMGREKAFEAVRGKRIIDRIVFRLQGQVAAVAINANADLSRFAYLDLPLISDLHVGSGTPLAGLHAALAFADTQGFDAVLTAPSDVPFLPTDLAHRLMMAGRRAAIAASGGQAHYLTGLWQRGLLSEAEQALNAVTVPRMQDWARRWEAAVVEWPATPYDPFFNVNTPQELAEAERVAAEFAL